jgi:hypothetical protein
MSERTFVESHVFALDLRARIAREGHVVHENVDVAAAVRKLAVDEFENDETGFCFALALNQIKMMI